MGYSCVCLSGSTYDGLVSIADWYGALAELAGVEVEDKRAAAANEWLSARNLPVLPPVDSTPNLLANILSGSKKNLRRVLHLSENAVIAWPHKLVTGPQPFSKWTGEIYPNCSEGADKPWFPDFKVFNEKLKYSSNKSYVDEHVWVQDCSRGCLYNILQDPSERQELSGGDSVLQKIKATLMQMLSTLNEGLFEPHRGEMQVDACRVGLKNGGYYGPFVDSEEYYTGPFPRKSFKERLSDEVYRGEMEFVNTPSVQRSILSAAEFLLPKFTNALQRSLDECKTHGFLDSFAEGVATIMNSSKPPAETIYVEEDIIVES